jgi:hypothetical protein
MSRIPYIYDDGGRAAAGFKGQTGDCVTRAIAIAARLPYHEVYADLNSIAIDIGSPLKGSTARTGVPRKVYDEYLRDLGWHWTPTMQVGTGCQVHLRPDELPSGRIIARLSKHLCAVVNGVIHDTHDCSRNGTRCVYGYWSR